MVSKFIFLIILLSLLSSCNRQKKQIEPESTDTDNQVTEIDESIWAVFQDSDDNYWFGSNRNGVYLYDGNSITQITEEDGLIDNTIRGFQKDADGNIYIETPKGVSKFDGEKFTTLEIVTTTMTPWQLNPDDLWFNCNGNASHVLRYDGESLSELSLPKQDLKEAFGIYESALNYSPYTVFGIDKDQEGNIWFGTVIAGAFRYDGESFLWFNDEELSRLEDGREPGVRSMLQDKDGYFWLSNFKSKYKIDQNGTSYEKLKGIDPDTEILYDKLPYFNGGLKDKEGNLWMITYGGGVWKYDGHELSNLEVMDKEKKVLLISIYEDNMGTLWLGSDNAGAYFFNGKDFEKFDLGKSN